MYYRKIKYWQHFSNGVIAENRREADYLQLFLVKTRMHMRHLEAVEIVDIQKYRLIQNKKKVAAMLQLPVAEKMFLFPVNIN